MNPERILVSYQGEETLLYVSLSGDEFLFRQGDPPRELLAEIREELAQLGLFEIENIRDDPSP